MAAIRCTKIAGYKYESIKEFRNRFLDVNNKPLSIQAVDYACRPEVDKIDYVQLGARIRVILLTPKTLAYVPNVTKSRSYPKRAFYDENEETMQVQNEEYFKNNLEYRKELKVKEKQLRKERDKKRLEKMEREKQERHALSKQKRLEKERLKELKEKELEAKRQKAIDLLKLSKLPRAKKPTVDQLLAQYRKENKTE